MKTSKLLSFILLFFCMIGCGKVHITENENTIIKLKGDSAILSEIEAEQVAKVSWMKIYGGDESKSNRQCPIVESVKACKDYSTKSSDSPRLAYVVNFQDSTGYAVVLAKKGAPSLVAITEQGALSSDRLSLALSNADVAGSGNENERIPEDEIVYDLLAREIISRNSYIAPNTIQADTTHSFQVLSQVRPLVSMKWGQKYPFNQDMPIMSSSTSNPYRGRAPVGCAVIAMAQVMQVNRHPSFEDLTSQYYSWSSFWWVSPFYDTSRFLPENYDNSTTSSEKYTVSILSKVFPILAEDFDADYSIDETTVSINDVLLGIKAYDSSYYGNATICYVNSNMFDLIDMIDNGKPTFIRGSESTDYNAGGHAWVTDGYIYVQEATIYGYFAQYYLHFNWGWNGSNDGYYALGAFSYSDRTFFDAVYDPWTPDANYNSNNCYNVKFIKY